MEGLVAENADLISTLVPHSTRVIFCESGQIHRWVFMKQAYAAIGRAVFQAQVFETVLIPIFEIFKMKTDPDYCSKTGGFISAGAFKVPTKNITKMLSDRGDIAPGLEERLNSFVEDRHLLIHRWIQQNGWPAEDDFDGFGPVIELANRVENEGRELTKMFAGYMVKYASPESARVDETEYNKRMTELFKRVHLDA